MPIPKILHQTYKNRDLSALFAHCQQEVQRLHPTFEYRFYTDEDIDRVMKTEFADYYETFMELPRMIMKIDMFRYCLLYKYGGIYLDMDYLMLKPFDLLEYDVVLPCNRESSTGVPECLGNCILASVPGHPFWKSLMDTLFTIDRRNISYKVDAKIDSFVLGTGPMFVYAMWKKYREGGIFVPCRNWFHPPCVTTSSEIAELLANGSYGMHFCIGSWRDERL